MKRLGIASFMAVVLAASNAFAQQPTFDFGFAGVPCGGEQQGAPNSDYSATVDVTLATSGNPSDTDGAQGWSMSLAADGLTITSITTDGTAGANAPDGLRSNGFEKSETTSGDGNEGAVTAVVLSFTEAITLPAEDNTATVAKIDVTGQLPGNEERTPVRLFFVDGRQGAGQPVENNVTWRGGTVKPVLGECAFDLFGFIPPQCPPPDGTPGVWTIIQGENVVTSGDMNAGGSPTPNGTEADAEVQLAPGEGTVYIGVVSNLDSGGVQGWSLAFGVDGDIDLVSATTDNTAGANAPVGLRSNGFEKTEVVDPALNSQGQGAVTAVVLSFTEAITLDPQGTATVACLNLSGEEGDTGRIFAKSGLRGAGQPVDNVATIGGGTAQYVCQQSATVVFSAPPVASYISGEVNGDQRIDLADPIFIINALFRGGPPIGCPAAADVNNDDMIDLSDVAFILEYLWMGGTAPEFLECTLDDTISPEDCPAGTTACP